MESKISYSIHEVKLDRIDHEGFFKCQVNLPV